MSEPKFATTRGAFPCSTTTGQATDETLATAFGDITDELARRGADAFLLAFKATSNDALDELLTYITHLAELVASIPPGYGRGGVGYALQALRFRDQVMADA